MKNIQTQIGSSLIEVMVALLVTAVGLLGVLTMHTKALKLNQNAHLYSQATILANDIMEAIKTTPDAVASYSLVKTGTAPASPGCTTSCTPEQMAQMNLNHWVTNISDLLPGGEGAIAINSTTNEILITVEFELGYEKNEAGEMVPLEKANVQLRAAG
ncbi:hypothetical protein TDB9533_04077 [Thalassocella blandensis]|nr:hypothetical protein TDB9533_04077 [Thalassocella blandensis]